ncbi:MAG: DUF3144 domain-containing protein [Bacteroidota bacterium]
MTNIDDKFYDRVDEHIALSNQQLASGSKGEVSAAMMYAVARYNAWLSAGGWNNAKELEEAKEKTIDYFVEEYRKKLTENLDDYIRNFDHYMNTK